MAWEIALIVIYAMSYIKVNELGTPLSALNQAAHVTYRFTRIRMVAFLYVTATTGSPKRAEWRDVLSNEVELLDSEYNALMYGGSYLGQENSVFQVDSPASTFETEAFANNFFK